MDCKKTMLLTLDALWFEMGCFKHALHFLHESYSVGIIEASETQKILRDWASSCRSSVDDNVWVNKDLEKAYLLIINYIEAMGWEKENELLRLEFYASKVLKKIDTIRQKINTLEHSNEKKELQNYLKQCQNIIEKIQTLKH